MLTSATSGLRILARQDALTENDLLRLLEERRLMLKKHLRDMTLKTLGELPFISDYFGDNTLKRYSETLRLEGDGRFNLETRGIFPLGDDGRLMITSIKYNETQVSGGQTLVGQRKSFWGLTRDGEWIHVDAFISRHTQQYEARGRHVQVACAESVSITEKSAEELSRLGLSLLKVWGRLGKAVKDWERHRESLLYDASELARVVRAEEDLIDVIVGKTRR